MLQHRNPMEVTSPETSTLAIWTIARFAALAVLATEALFFYARRRDPHPRPGAAVFWALTPALPGRTAMYAPAKAIATKYIEGFVVVIEIFLLFGLSTPVWLAYKNNVPDAGKALRVRLVAEQFAWNFQYPGKDGKFGKTDSSLISGDNPLGVDPEDPAGKDDVVTVNNLHLPTNRPVIVDVSSKDVIHSFNIPVLR